MAQNDILKRYIDAVADFSELTQRRAEALVKELVKAGEVQGDQAREAVTELLERSRRNSEKLLETVRKEVRSQITSLGLASHADLDRFEARIASLLGTATAPATQAVATTKRAAKKTTAKKAPAKKAGAKKAGAKKKAVKKKAAKQAGPTSTSVTKG
jgi:polyhydroxyalkanoate synthesis regulator phasin